MNKRMFFFLMDVGILFTFLGVVLGLVVLLWLSVVAFEALFHLIGQLPVAQPTPVTVGLLALALTGIGFLFLGMGILCRWIRVRRGQPQ